MKEVSNIIVHPRQNPSSSIDIVAYSPQQEDSD